MRALIVPCLAALLLAGGCENSNTSFFVTGVALVSVDSGGACEYPLGARLIRGEVNTAGDTGYTLGLQVANQMVQRNGTVTPNPNDIHVRYIDIELQGADGNALAMGLPNPYRVQALSGGYVPAGMGIMPGQAVVGVEAIPAVYYSELAAFAGTPITINMTLRAETLGRENVQSEFNWSAVLVNDASDSICRTELVLLDEDVQGLVLCAPGQDGTPIYDPDC